MTSATKGVLVGMAMGALVWAGTGMWQFLAMSAMGAMCTWLFTYPGRPRRRVREFVRVEIRDIEHLAQCYDYGGCQWAGDGCAGKPLVLGPGRGCPHIRQLSAGKRCLDDGGPLCANDCNACDQERL